MKQITNIEYERYQEYLRAQLHGQLLTPSGLRIVCAGFDYDPVKIGTQMLDMLAKFRSEGIVEEIIDRR